MGTKNNPGPNDCYARAMPDEPVFTLLARDPSAPGFIRAWAERRALEINIAHRPHSDRALVDEAMKCADEMEQWRVDNDGKWRTHDLFEENDGLYRLGDGSGDPAGLS